MPFQRLPAYAPHADFIAPARPRSEWWRLILGCVTLVIVHQAIAAAVISLIRQRYGDTFSGALITAISFGRTPGSLVILLASYVFLGLSVTIVVRTVHDRKPLTLIGPRPLAAARTVARLAPLLVALGLFTLPLTLMQPEIARHQSLSTLIVWLPLALPALLIQVVSEELVFRGYLQQQLAALSGSPLIWMLIPTALFAFGHYDARTYGPNALLVCGWAAIFGCFAADLTARSGNLGAAIAFHLAANFMSLTLTGNSGYLDGLALWTSNADLADPAAFRPLLLLDLLSMLNAWLLARIALGR